MPFTTPKTWSVNEVVTAANMNTHLRDNMAWVATDMPHCRALRAAVQTLGTSGTAEVIAFSDADAFDVGAMHNPASNNSRITVPSGGGGVYFIGCQGTFAANSTGERRLQIRLNGTTNIFENRHQSVANALPMQVWGFYALVAGDFVEILATQVSGGSLDISNLAFWAAWYAT